MPPTTYVTWRAINSGLQGPQEAGGEVIFDMEASVRGEVPL